MLPGTAIATVVVASATGWIAGYVTPGAPGGVGVREAVFLVAVGQESLVITLAVIGFRLVSVTADLIVFFIGALVDRQSSSTTEDLDQP
jgi:glycosyltransferase 2 family protein